ADKPVEYIEDYVYLDADKLELVLKESFWSADSGKLHVINSRGDLVKAVEKDVPNTVRERFGRLYDHDAAEIVDEVITDAKGKTTVQGVVIRTILNHVKYHNQRDQLRWSTDMFAQHDYMTMENQRAGINLKHRPYREEGFEDEIVQDFIEHFPQFVEVVEWVVDARFSSDRKNCFLWIKADSDFGKGLFTSSLGDLGAAANLSEKETDKAMSGEPFGKQPKDFVGANAIIFNEVLGITRSIKTAESSIEISPKNQLTSQVPIYAKI